MPILELDNFDPDSNRGASRRAERLKRRLDGRVAGAAAGAYHSEIGEESALHCRIDLAIGEHGWTSGFTAQPEADGGWTVEAGRQGEDRPLRLPSDDAVEAAFAAWMVDWRSLHAEAIGRHRRLRRRRVLTRGAGVAAALAAIGLSMATCEYLATSSVERALGTLSAVR